MRLCSSLVLEILKGETEIELLSKLNWWLFKGGWELNSELVLKFFFEYFLSVLFLIDVLPHFLKLWVVFFVFEVWTNRKNE